jgi:hypothetical protein
MVNATFVEADCAFVHEGRSFTSGGAAVTDDYALVYIGDAIKREGSLGSLDVGDYHATDWHGNIIGRAHLVSSWRVPNGWLSGRLCAYYVTIYGRPPRHYNVRGSGQGMVARGARVKRERGS